MMIYAGMGMGMRRRMKVRVVKRKKRRGRLMEMEKGRMGLWKMMQRVKMRIWRRWLWNLLHHGGMQIWTRITMPRSSALDVTSRARCKICCIVKSIMHKLRLEAMLYDVMDVNVI
jgi:hypothetical protein